MEFSLTKLLSCCFGIKMHWNKKNKKKPTNLWEDLPLDILASIADSLGLIDLLGFRGVCKSWRASSSRATARVESSQGLAPWFLLYRDKSPCLLLDDKYHKRYIDIPELEGASCFASSHGWLLLYKQGSVFFFCPFSRCRIDLPELPSSQVLTDHIAAFSSPPTSKECVVCVPIRNKDSKKLEVMVISRGECQWTKRKPKYVVNDMSNISTAACYNGAFYFWDVGDLLVKFSPRDKNWTGHIMVKPSEALPDTPMLPFGRIKMTEDWKEHSKDWLGSEEHSKDWLGSEDDFSISTCGTMVHEDKYDRLIENEISNPEQPDSSGLKGIWFHPRFFQVPRDQTW